MQMADDGRVVIFSTAFARTDAPGQRTQFVRCGLDRIDACEGRDFRSLLLRLSDQRTDWPLDGWEGRGLKGHLDPQIGTKTSHRIEFVGIGKICLKEPAFVA